MQLFFDFLLANVRPIVMLVGMLMMVVGIITLFGQNKVAATMLIILGAGLVATPVLKQFTAGGEYGVSLITNFNETNEKLAKATDANTKAIEEIKVGLLAVRQLIGDLKIEGALNPTKPFVFPLDKFQNFNNKTDNVLKQLDFNLDASKTLNDAISKQLDQQKDIIQEMQ